MQIASGMICAPSGFRINIGNYGDPNSTISIDLGLLIEFEQFKALYQTVSWKPLHWLEFQGELNSVNLTVKLKL